MADGKKYFRVEKGMLQRLIKERADKIVDERIQSETERLHRELEEERERLFGEKGKRRGRREELERAVDRDSAIYRKNDRAPKPEESEDWFVTYSDIITLLLTLFVVIFAWSDFDQERFETVKQSINKDLLKKEENTSFMRLQNDLRRVFNDYNIRKEVTVSMAPRGVEIEFASSSLYDAGSADIKGATTPLLADIRETIREFDYEDYLVEVEGHTDDVPISTDRYPSNWELSSARAANIVKFFIAGGVDPERLRVAGYADVRPKYPNVNDAGEPIPANRAANRRVVIYIKRGDNLPPDAPY